MFCFLIFWPVTAQSSTGDLPYTSIQEVPQSTWDELAQKKIFFGHHSVGDNILQGLSLILAENPNIKLKIFSSKDVGSRIFSAGLFEGGVGKNFYPETKLETFKEKIEGGYGQTADIVFFKFLPLSETLVNAFYRYIFNSDRIYMSIIFLY